MGRMSFEDLIKTQSWTLIIESRNNELVLRISKMNVKNDMSKLN